MLGRYPPGLTDTRWISAKDHAGGGGSTDTPDTSGSTEVYVGAPASDGSAFHTSKACAPTPAKRVRCTLQEAVEAMREPCGNCVGDDVREEYKEILTGGGDR